MNFGSEERSLDERRDRRSRLQLNIPLRTGGVWTKRVILSLQLQQRRQASAFAHLAQLGPDPERPSFTVQRLPIYVQGRLRPQVHPLSNKYVKLNTPLIWLVSRPLPPVLNHCCTKP
jgi:hypothetical protein